MPRRGEAAMIDHVARDWRFHFPSSRPALHAHNAAAAAAPGLGIDRKFTFRGISCSECADPPAARCGTFISMNSAMSWRWLACCVCFLGCGHDESPGGAAGAVASAAGGGRMMSALASAAGGTLADAGRAASGGAGRGAPVAGGVAATAGAGRGGRGAAGSRGGAGAAGVDAPSSGAGGHAGAAANSGGMAGAISCDPDYDANNPPQELALTGNLGTHDPSMIEANGQFYLFHTGRGLPMKRSSDLLAWQATGSVFTSNPAWIAQHVSGVSDLWAPDISFFAGLYHVYYAASTSGSNHSCIGHATSATPDGGFVDQGLVICSNDGGSNDDWNAIDPNLVLDDAGNPFLAFGSFWGGLKLIELDQTGARANDKMTSLAARPNNGGAIEASYIVHRCGYYYLFASFDRCCDGANSTYNIRVGRASALGGPYADKQGTAMMMGGGTLLVQGDTTWAGPGHNAVIFHAGQTLNIYHSYYAGASNGTYNKDASYLRISQIAWDDQGWPISAGP
jgi:arabinan endo-1,5-alpha-L-arabinosidase